MLCLYCFLFLRSMWSKLGRYLLEKRSAIFEFFSCNIWSSFFLLLWVWWTKLCGNNMQVRSSEQMNWNLLLELVRTFFFLGWCYGEEGIILFQFFLNGQIRRKCVIPSTMYAFWQHHSHMNLSHHQEVLKTDNLCLAWLMESMQPISF